VWKRVRKISLKKNEGTPKNSSRKKIAAEQEGGEIVPTEPDDKHGHDDQDESVTVEESVEEGKEDEVEKNEGKPKNSSSKKREAEQKGKDSKKKQDEKILSNIICKKRLDKIFITRIF
jgi:hypothetical protein